MTQPFLGEIKMFGGNFAPRGFAFCNGQLMDISQNQNLYALIGTTYGGDGQNTFGLPNLQGRIPLNQGQGAGLTNRVLGELSGTESVTLTINQMPQHNHQPVSPRIDALRHAAYEAPVPVDIRLTNGAREFCLYG